MHKLTFTFTVLCLFTSADRAAEIEGDLLEQAQQHGALWYCVQVIATCFALFAQALRAEPVVQLLMGYAVYELAVNLNWWMLRPLRFMLGTTLKAPGAEMLLLNGSVNALFALLLSMTAGKMAPRRATQIVIIASALMLARLTLLRGTEFALLTAAFTLVPAFVGLMVMKTLELRKTQAPREGMRQGTSE